jgi:Tol biopolymer transport system component
MPLTIGSQLGSHEITALIGKGGMGEVYRAHDTKLKREVAIKILPDEFSRDSDRIGRFQREAQVLASLNHPNIAGIYDLQEASGSRYLVLELVEGETLADRLSRGPMPVNEALRIATDICDALEAAHERGIVHRDLKPANVKITPDGKVKVLDFGLAKALEASPTTSALSNSPTLSMAATQAGVILGTAAYMSPEQAKGLHTDARSDVFSFGCVLYEMLTGRQAFDFDTTTEILAAILMREPDLSALPADLNPRITDLLRRCLEKNPKRRWQAIGDLRVELENIAAVAKPVLVWKRAFRPAVIGIAGILAIIIAGVAGYTLKPSSAAAVIRFPLVLPEGQRLLTAVSSHAVAISPDGSRLVYLASGQLLVRSMSEMEARPIAGTSSTDAAQVIAEPFFSPDGQWIGYYSRADATLKKVAATGGAPVTLCKTDSVSGAHWAGDYIYFARLRDQGIMRLPSSGGEPEEIIRRQPGESLHGPQLLDDGLSLLFTATTAQGESRWDKAQIVVQSLRSGERKVLIRGGTDAHYIPTGHLVYALGGTLFAVPFDSRKQEIHGTPAPILEGVMRTNSINTGAAQFAFSTTGTLVYVPGTTLSTTPQRRLALADRTGSAKPLPLPPQTYSSPRVSPDGKQLAFGTDDGKDSIVWVYDLKSSNPARRLTFGGRNSYPVWSRDGRSITFTSDREGGVELFRQSADGSGSPERLTKSRQSDSPIPESWSSDGRTLLYFNNATGANIRALRMLSLDGEKPSKPFIEPAGGLTQANSSFSPDGRWVAYNSNEPDARNMHVFVQPFPPTGAKYQLPGEGNVQFVAPAWSSDGKQLYYGVGVGTNQLVAVDIQTTPSFTFGKPIPIRIDGFIGNGGNNRNYDIMSDGKQIVAVIDASTPQTGGDRPAPPQVNVVVNWFEELKRISAR